MVIWVVMGLVLGGSLFGQEGPKLKPIVHVFGNAEYNPSENVTRDYSFWMGRMLVGFQGEFSSKWSTKVQIDRFRLENSVNTMYVKMANLRYTPNDKIAVEGGVIAQNNYIPFETFYGYRFVAETFQDRYYGIPSTDIGIAGYFRPWKKLTFDLALTNGEGPKIDQDNFGELKMAGGFTFNPLEQIQTRAYYSYKPALHAESVGEHLINGYLGFKAGDFLRAGTELTYVDGFQHLPVKSWGTSTFAWITLYKSFKFLARYDDVIYSKPDNLDTILPFSGNALITGFSMNPLKGITLCLNYQGFFYDFNLKPDSHRILFSFEYRI
jgi:hypothetical protein